MHEVTWYSLLSLIFITLAQHETAVVLWYYLFLPAFEHWSGAVLATFLTVSVIDLAWLYCLFFVFRKSLGRLSRSPWVQRMIGRLEQKSWFQKLRSFFKRPQEVTGTAEVHASDSRFRKFIKRSGHLGILLCGSLPGPGLKEIGIMMALTPKFRDSGFILMYVGGLIKTTMTLLVYGGLYRVIQSLIENMVA